VVAAPPVVASEVVEGDCGCDGVGGGEHLGLLQKLECVVQLVCRKSMVMRRGCQGTAKSQGLDDGHTMLQVLQCTSVQNVAQLVRKFMHCLAGCTAHADLDFKSALQEFNRLFSTTLRSKFFIMMGRLISTAKNLKYLRKTCFCSKLAFETSSETASSSM
jgi:hypothetical protein